MIPVHVQLAVDRALVNDEYRLNLRVGDKTLPLDPIGSGSFAFAFRSAEEPRDVFVFTDKSVKDKSIMCRAHNKAKDNPHLAAVQHLGTLRAREPVPTMDGHPLRSLYRMPYYKVPVPPRTVADDQRLRLSACGHKEDSLKAVVDCAERWEVPGSLVEALKLLTKESSKVAKSYVFDFDNRWNFGVDDQGNLVLLDPLYREV